jgi:hypothetical protein
MNKIVPNILVVVTLSVATVLLLEGLYAVTQWDEFDGSVTYKTYKRFVAEQERVPWHGEEPEEPEPEGPPFTRLLTREEIDILIPKLKAAAVGLGHSRYIELKQEAASINTKDERGCNTHKAHLHKTLTHLRSNFSDPLLHPLSMFFDSDREFDPEIKRLIDIYGLRLVTLTTNGQGERITVPAITSNHKVIIAGDSVAFGTMVDDSETISSRLQALDPARQYINVGVNGANALDITCALNKAAQRYKGQIEELIYVYCENDFKPRHRYGTPEAVMAWLRQFVQAQGIDKVTVVYAPYIVNIVPQITRLRGSSREWNRPTRARERAALAALVKEAGFNYIDISDLALAEAERAKTQFAALSLFVDVAHLSPYGIARLVEKLRTR